MPGGTHQGPGGRERENMNEQEPGVLILLGSAVGLRGFMDSLG